MPDHGVFLISVNLNLNNLIQIADFEGNGIIILLYKVKIVIIVLKYKVIIYKHCGLKSSRKCIFFKPLSLRISLGPNKEVRYAIDNQ